MDLTAETITHTIGVLCVGGDWACSNGDLEALGNIAKQLAAYAHNPLHRKLTVLTEMCRRDPDNAVATWMWLKDQILAENGRPPPGYRG